MYPLSFSVKYFLKKIPEKVDNKGKEREYRNYKGGEKIDQIGIWTRSTRNRTWVRSLLDEDKKNGKGTQLLRCPVP